MPCAAYGMDACPPDGGMFSELGSDCLLTGRSFFLLPIVIPLQSAGAKNYSLATVGIRRAPAPSTHLHIDCPSCSAYQTPDPVMGFGGCGSTNLLDQGRSRQC